MQVKLRSCFKCKYEIETAEIKCARCGLHLRSRTQIRVLGAVLFFLGALIIGIIGFITSWMYGVVFHPETTNGERFTGTGGDLVVISGILGFVLLFGFVVTITGLWQLILGKRNTILVWAILGLGAIFIIGGNAAMFIAK